MAFIINKEFCCAGIFPDSEYTLARGQVTVDLLRVKMWLDTADNLIEFLTDFGMEVPKMDIGDECNLMSEGEYFEISCHLHEAYVHQIAYKRRSVAGAKDSVSSETLQCSDNAQFGIDGLIRTTPTSVRMRGWTWIPSSVESRWCQ
ncbi:hypothetical protein BKA56DRAFT_594659 [Ilyonectria sp. MPI-CAGE-AT-0026]|nr:hypothetical protein BKA56DRAFT_594659 [Ilyonectria sp. MPI-CAGE-AT-0026]